MTKKIIHYALVLILLLLCVESCIHAQDYPYIHFTVDDGLPSNMVYSIYSDHKGFIWVATDKGVARYNGVKFEVFTTFNGLPDNEIFFFIEDNYQRIWMGTYNGELCYYKNGVIHTAANTPFLKTGQKNSFLSNISVESDSSVLFIYSNYSLFINEKNEHLTLVKIKNKDYDSSFANPEIIKKSNNNAYDLYYLDKKITIDTLSNKINEKVLYNNIAANEYWQEVYCQDSNYILNNRFVYNDKLEIIKPINSETYNNVHKYNIFIDKNKNTFTASNNGIYYNDSINILRGKKTSCITQDALGRHWVSTLNDGVYLVDKNIFTSHLYDSVYSGDVKYAAIRDNKVFFSTVNNNVYQFVNGKTTCLFNYFKTKKEKYSYPLNSTCIIDDKNNFYSFYNDDFVYINNVLSENKRVKILKSIFNSSDVTKSLVCTNDYLYIQTKYSIYSLRLETLDGKQPVDYKKVSDNARYEIIYCMENSKDGSIWYSTISNIYKIQNGQQVVQRQFKGITFKSFIFFDNYLVGYTHNNLLLVCAGFDSPNIVVDTTKEQNCIWDKFYRIDSAHLFISTNNEYRLLAIAQSEAGHPYHISALENNFLPLNTEAISCDPDHICFFKNETITSVKVNNLISDNTPPSLYFSLLRSTHNNYPILQETEIPYSESKNISISFSSLSLSSKNIYYQYSLSRNDKDKWININSEEIDLAHPGWGKYFVKLRAKNISGSFSAPIMFTLIISTPFWAQWWFIALCSIMAVSIVAFIIRYRIYRLIHQREAAYQARIKFIRSEYTAQNALMNPHFVFNTLNNVQGLINKNDKLGANESLRIFADLIRQNMSNLSKELITLQKEISLITNYLLLEKLRFKDYLNYTMLIEEDVDTDSIMVPPLLMQPLIENAIKHGILPTQSKEGFIHIHIYIHEQTLFIEIADNGIGISVARKNISDLHESYGLKNINKRIEQLSIILNKKIMLHINDVVDPAGNIKGTKAVICIPLGN